LVKVNPWSPSLNNPNIKYILQDVYNPKKFLPVLFRKGFKFDSCIIDPPKTKLVSAIHFSRDILIMHHVYSVRYLKALATVLKEGATVSTWLPPAGISPVFQQTVSNLIPIFESTGCFTFVGNYRELDSIYCFRRQIQTPVEPNEELPSSETVVVE
jgi:hypothetical protein